ncbi:protein of unknown function DUF89 [Trinorchestia longiramus]|nr:protein of unknown function DUF89 [Trinorchestia longiramus]
MELPIPLSAEVIGSFAYFTVKDRLPVILTSVIDYLCQEKLNIVDEYGKIASEELKAVIAVLSQLKNEMQTNKPLKLFPLIEPPPKHDDTVQWNEYIAAYQRERGRPPSWFTSPWLVVECFLYKSIHHAFLRTTTMKALDPFQKQKMAALQQSRDAVAALEQFTLCLLEEVTQDTPSHVVACAITAMLELCVWGNQCDLSISGGALVVGGPSDDGGVPAASVATSRLSTLAYTAQVFGVEVGRPRSAADSVNPAADSVNPAADSVNPAADSVNPAADSVNPAADSVNPTADSVNPAADSVNPAADSVNLTADSVNLTADSVNPAADSASNLVTDEGKELRPAGDANEAVANSTGCPDGSVKLLQWLSSSRKNFLINESPRICELLRATPEAGRSVALVLDNAGYELLTDVCLTLLLLRAGVVRMVCSYVKTRPWFVSDTTAADITYTLNWLSCEGFTGLAEAWRAAMTSQQWQVKEDSYWTTHQSFRDMMTSRPDLYKELSQTGLVIFKGDLNYRKLVGDLNWPSTTPFSTALGPDLALLGPIVALRTVKGGPAVGATEAQLLKVKERLGDHEWATKGGCGMIQLSLP